MVEVLGLPLRLYAIGAVALALLGLGVALKIQTGRLTKAQTVAAQATANLNALQIAHARERKLQQDASNDYEARLKALYDRKVDTPVRTVRLCGSPTGYVPAHPRRHRRRALRTRRRGRQSRSAVSGVG